MTDFISKLKDKTAIFYGIVVALLPLFVIATIYSGVILYQVSVQLTEMGDHIGKIEYRTTGLEKKQTEYDGQLAQFDGKLTAFTNSPVLKAVEHLAPRISILEKQLASMRARQRFTTVSPKPIQSDKKQYYEVKDGDTLYRISKKYGLSADELLRMNDCDENDQLIVVGKRIVVSR